MLLPALILALVLLSFRFAWVYAGKLDEREEGEWAYLHSSFRAGSPIPSAPAGPEPLRRPNHATPGTGTDPASGNVPASVGASVAGLLLRRF